MIRRELHNNFTRRSSPPHHLHCLQQRSADSTISSIVPSSGKNEDDPKGGWVNIEAVKNISLECRGLSNRISSELCYSVNSPAVPNMYVSPNPHQPPIPDNRQFNEGLHTYQRYRISHRCLLKAQSDALPLILDRWTEAVTLPPVVVVVQPSSSHAFIILISVPPPRVNIAVVVINHMPPKAWSITHHSSFWSILLIPFRGYFRYSTKPSLPLIFFWL